MPPAWALDTPRSGKRLISYGLIFDSPSWVGKSACQWQALAAALTTGNLEEKEALAPLAQSILSFQRLLELNPNNMTGWSFVGNVAMCKRVSITHDLEIWSKKAESNTKSQNHVSNNLAGMTSTHPTHLHDVYSNWVHSTFSFYGRQGPWLSWAGLTRFTRVEYSAKMWMCLAEIHSGCWSGGLTFQDVRATCSALPCMLLQRSMEPKCIWLSQEDCTRMSRTSWIMNMEQE